MGLSSKKERKVHETKSNLRPSSPVIPGKVPNFMAEFPSMCAEENVHKIPTVTLLQEQSISTLHKSSTDESESVATETGSEPLSQTVLVVYDVNVLRKVFIKGFSLEIGLLNALRRCLLIYNTLTTIKLHNCRMTNEMLAQLAISLTESKTIRELSLDMNPIPEQSYFLLLTDNRLQYLSLGHCKIDDYAVSLMSHELEYKEGGQAIVYLNLAFNNITCEGVQYLANALRTNRILGAISLAGNNIGDDGVLALTEVMQKFALTHEEAVVRRHRNLKWLKYRNTQLEKRLQASKTQVMPSPAKDITSRGSSRKRDLRTASAKDRRKGASKESKANASTNLASPIHLATESSRTLKGPLSAVDIRRMEQQIIQEIEPDPHPYMTSVKPADGDLWCSGNFKLAHINLAYNHIGVPSHKAFLQVIRYQDSILQANPLQPHKGLLSVVIQGNPIVDIAVMSELLDLLATRSSTYSDGRKNSPVRTSPPRMTNPRHK